MLLKSFLFKTVHTTIITAGAILLLFPIQIYATEQSPPVDSLYDNIHIPEMSERNNSPLSKSSRYSTYYNAAEDDIVTEVKNQSPFGSCWAFAAMSCAETNCIKQGFLKNSEADFSELQFAYFTYHEKSDPLNMTGKDGAFVVKSGINFMDIGGTYEMATGGLASWMGPVHEKYVPYTKATEISDVENLIIDSKYAYGSAMAHLEQARWIPATDMEGIKEAILAYGSVAASYYNDANFYSTDETAYNEDSYKSQNHAIVIVGWDDNFPKKTFKKMPSSDGAWLVKNSWGLSSGDEGFFWMSYECSSFLSGSVVAYQYNKADKYDFNYQYDGCPNTSAFTSYGTSSAYMSNIFSCQNEERLEAVGFYVLNSDINYEVKVYTGIDEDSPASGTLRAVSSGTCNFEGYYTVPLNQGVNLEQGERFSVVVHLSVTDKEIHLPIEVSNNGNFYKFVASSEYGQSFTSGTGERWTDRGTKGNIRIKAFTCKRRNSTDVNLQRLSIVSKPSKLIYDKGAAFETDGICVLAEYTNGSNSIVTDQCSFSGFSSDTAGVKNIKVSYNGKSVSFVILIKPGTPDISAKKLENGQVKISWGLLLGADGYSVSRATDGCSDYKVIGTTSGSSYTDTTAAAGKKYCYRVRAYISDGAESYYGPVSNTLVFAYEKQVEAPKMVRAVFKNPKAMLSWSYVQDASGYSVYASGKKNGQYSLVSSTSGTSCAVSIPYGYTMYFYVKSYCIKDGKRSYSLPSEIVSAKASIPQTNIKSIQNISGRSIQLRWGKVSGVSGYLIYRSETTNGKYSIVKIISSEKTLSWKDTSVFCPKTYYYKVCAFYLDGNIMRKGPLSKEVVIKVKLDTVLGFKARYKAKKVILTWNRVADADGYEIYILDAKKKVYKRLKTISGGRTCSISIQRKELNGSRNFKVRAYILVKGKKYCGDFSKKLSIS